jgi:hypothetical protein
MKCLVTAFSCILAVLMIAPSSSRATQIIYQSPEQLGQQSTLVVRGLVVSVDSHWNDKHTKVFTTTRVAVDETYKGVSIPTVDIVQLGGVVGTVKVTVAGALQWKAGEEVLLFLEPYRQGTYQVSGFSQGKFNIEHDPRTGARFITQPALGGVELVNTPSGKPTASAATIEKVSLDTFVSRALGSKQGGGSR